MIKRKTLQIRVEEGGCASNKKYIKNDKIF
jgi:hypothetical protein